MNLPSKLIKTLSSEENAKSFAEGNMWLRSVSYFKDIEKGERNDKREFEARYSCSDGNTYNGSLIQDAFILSLSFIDEEPISGWNKFGKHHVLIKNPCALFHEIQEQLRPILKETTSSFFGKVLYRDVNDLYKPKPYFFCKKIYKNENEPQPELLSIELAFCKEKKRFEEEKEGRMIFLYNQKSIEHCFKDSKNSEQIEILLLREENTYDPKFKKYHSTIKTSYRYFDFDEWKKSNIEKFYDEKCHSWVEVKFKVDPKHFELIN